MRLTSPISFSDNAARLPMPKRLISSFFVVVIMVVVWYNAVNLASFSGNVGRKDAPGTGGHIQPAQQQKPESNLAKIANGGEEVPSQGAPESSLPSSFPKLPPPDNEEYMAFCMVVKNQSIDLPEFFTHHYHHHGIRRFYIWDDGTVPPLSDTVYPIPSHAITWEYQQPYVHSDVLGAREGIQEKYYTDCVHKYGSKHSWIGFLDVDEFLEMTGNETLSEFLRGWATNDTVGALSVNWKTHSSAGLLTRPAAGARKSFNRCIVDDPKNDNLKVKTFTRTDLFEGMDNCHCVSRLKNGTVQVGEHGDIVYHTCDRNPMTRDRWALHHYGPKSRGEFLQKQERGKIRGGKSGEEWWNRIENAEQYDCLEMTMYEP